MDILLIIAIALSIFYLGYIVFEKLYNDKIRKSFKYVIHVNGIRGKSTTTRLIDAGFRKLGYKVFSKTTGTYPVMINTENCDTPVLRLGKANIREQIRMMRKAYKEKAEVVVLECMAVNPELQEICEHRILHSNVVVITNVREDHIGEMGDTLEELAYALSLTTPDNGTLILHDDKYYDIFKRQAIKNNSKIVISEKLTKENTIDTFIDNIENALEVARVLGLDTDLFYEGMKEYHHDLGSYQELKIDDTIFINALSVNDSESLRINYDKVIQKYDSNDLTILLNSREDRPSRTIQHIKLLKEIKYKKIILSGSAIYYVKKRLEKEGINVSVLKKIEDLKNEKVIFGIGNIAGIGGKILDYFKENGERI